MKRFGLLLLMWVGILTQGCGQLTTKPSTSLPIEQVHHERRSGARHQREEVITTAARWREVWDEIVSDRYPKPPIPAVDFSSTVLIYVARGETGDVCRGTSIARVELRDDRFEVFVDDTRPPMSCVCPPVSGQPVHVVAVRRAARRAAFQYRSTTTGELCN